MERAPLWRMLLGRTLSAFPTLFFASLLTFVLIGVLPGSTAQQLLGPDATVDQVAALEAQLGLDRPAAGRYLEWLGGLISGDLGESIVSGRPLNAMLAERLPVTIELAAFSLAISFGLAIPIALLAARHPGGFVDYVITAVCMVSLSVPNYVLALVLILILAVGVTIFPTIGFVPVGEGIGGHIVSLTLPAVALAVPMFALNVRMLRNDLLEQISRETYILAAAAKGLGPWQILIRHALRNSMFGLLTVLGINLGTLIGGTVVVEQIFSLPGIGQLLVQSIHNRDALVIQGVVMALVTITVLGNLVVDVLYVLLDPRVRYRADL